MREDWTRRVAALTPSVDLVETVLSETIGAVTVEAVVPLHGGLANTMLRCDLAGRASVVLRVYQRDPAVAAKEAAVVRRVAAAGVPVPDLLWQGETRLGVASVFAYVEGQRLDQVVPDRGLGCALGRVLAALHAIRFPRTGFLDAHLSVCEPLDMSGRGLADFVEWCLANGARAHLGGDLTVALRDGIARWIPRMDAWAAPACLTHADFGATNLIIRDGHVVAVLDWEFALAGVPFGDFGNLLRPPLGAVPGFADAVAAGYRGAGGDLPDDWLARSWLSDLTAWTEFLTRPGASAALIADARKHIAAILEDLDGGGLGVG